MRTINFKNIIVTLLFVCAFAFGVAAQTVKLDKLVETKSPPAYPSAAKAVRAEGTVVVKVTVGEDGKVVSAAALSGHPLLRRSAENAARQTTFRPGAFSKTGTLTFKFNLRDEVR